MLQPENSGAVCGLDASLEVRPVEGDCFSDGRPVGRVQAGVLLEDVTPEIGRPVQEEGGRRPGDGDGWACDEAGYQRPVHDVGEGIGSGGTQGSVLGPVGGEFLICTSETNAAGPD